MSTFTNLTVQVVNNCLINKPVCNITLACRIAGEGNRLCLCTVVQPCRFLHEKAVGTSVTKCKLQLCTSKLRINGWTLVRRFLQTCARWRDTFATQFLSVSSRSWPSYWRSKIKIEHIGKFVRDYLANGDRTNIAVANTQEVICALSTRKTFV